MQRPAIDAQALQELLAPGLSVQEAIDLLFEAENIPEGVQEIHIAPPDPAILTDEDSAHSEEGCLLDNLNHRQLSADAEVRFHNPEVQDFFFQFHPTTQKRSWIKGDMTSFLPSFPLPNSELLKKYSQMSPVQLFELFFDDELVNIFCCESNKYALYLNCPHPNISPEEVKVFLGILILSGYDPKPNKRLYWDSCDDARNYMAANAMNRNRFESILRFFHCNDNSNPDLTDKLFKIRPLINQVLANCKKYYLPEENFSYDESMVKYFGRHSCKQFIRGKPIRFGYKVWALATSSGYLRDFKIYQGKSLSRNNEVEKKFGKPTAPFIGMLENLEKDVGKYPFSFYFDNLFTSMNLLKFLREKGYGGTGTMRENRLPKNKVFSPGKVVKKTKKRGYIKSRICKQDGVNIVQWVDNSTIIMASNIFGVKPITFSRRYSKKDRKFINVRQPYSINKYNKGMGGVDRMDQNLAKYRINIRNKKWYWPLLSWLIDVCVNNAWQLKRKAGSNMAQLDFRRHIVQTYLIKYKSQTILGRPPTRKAPIEDIRFDQMNHFIRGTQGNKKRRCVGPYCKGKSSGMRTECEKCNVGLCVQCFAPYHKK